MRCIAPPVRSRAMHFGRFRSQAVDWRRVDSLRLSPATNRETALRLLLTADDAAAALRRLPQVPRAERHFVGPLARHVRFGSADLPGRTSMRRKSLRAFYE